MFVFLALSTLYRNDRLSMATKSYRAAKLYQRPVNHEKPVYVEIDL